MSVAYDPDLGFVGAPLEPGDPQAEPSNYVEANRGNAAAQPSGGGGLVAAAAVLGVLILIGVAAVVLR